MNRWRCECGAINCGCRRTCADPNCHQKRPKNPKWIKHE